VNRLNEAAVSGYVNVFFAFPALGRYLLGRLRAAGNE
jgi:hypothetical protein